MDEKITGPAERAETLPGIIEGQFSAVQGAVFHIAGMVASGEEFPWC